MYVWGELQARAPVMPLAPMSETSDEAAQGVRYSADDHASLL